MTVDEFAVGVPTIRDYDDLPEGYDRGESWWPSSSQRCLEPLYPHPLWIAL
jgi:hypothetical protein